jgi:hypothetical protein
MARAIGDSGLLVMNSISGGFGPFFILVDSYLSLLLSKDLREREI